MTDRICFIGGGLQGGGQERGLVNLANYFSDSGYSVSIINLFKTEQFYPTDERVIIYWPDVSRARYHRLLYALKVLPFLRRKIKEFKPDVILSFGEWFNPFVFVSTRLLNVPVFLCDRMGPNMVLDPLIQLFRKLTYRYSDGVLVQTKVAAEIVHQLTGAKKIKVLPNPLNPVNSDTSIKINRIVAIGRLSVEKGHIHLLRAFSQIRNQDWTLAIVGDGPERLNLQKESERLHIGNTVKFYGQLKDFAYLLGESEIFVLPSLHEGFPNALLEAMSVPLACISSDCVAGPGEIIQHRVNGLLVKPGDEKELAEAIELLIMNPDMRRNLAQEAYKVREKYSFDKIAREYFSFILPETSL